MSNEPNYRSYGWPHSGPCSGDARALRAGEGSHRQCAGCREFFHEREMRAGEMCPECADEKAEEILEAFAAEEARARAERIALLVEGVGIALVLVGVSAAGWLIFAL